MPRLPRTGLGALIETLVFGAVILILTLAGFSVVVLLLAAVQS